MLLFVYLYITFSVFCYFAFFEGWKNSKSLLLSRLEKLEYQSVKDFIRVHFFLQSPASLDYHFMYTQNTMGPISQDRHCTWLMQAFTGTWDFSH